METKKLKIGEIEFTIKAMSFLDECNFYEKNQSGRINPKEIIKMCVTEPKITDAILEGMTSAEGKSLFGEINKLNGWVSLDFQTLPKD